MKKIIALLFFVIAIQAVAQAPVQQEIAEAKMVFTLPNQEWKLASKQITKNKHAVYRYERAPIAGKNKKNIPAITIIVEPRPAEQTLTTYSTARLNTIKKQAAFREEKVFTNSDGMLKLPYAIGYKCYYNDNTAVPHTLYVIHALHNGKGMQIWLDIASENFSDYEEELTSVIRSFQYK